MTLTLTAALKASITGGYSSSRALNTGQYPLSLAINNALTSGTGANQCDRVFDDTRTLAPSATENLDLTTGLLDAFGNTFAPVTVRAILFMAAAANTNNVVIGNAASNGFFWSLDAATDTIALRPSASAVFFDPVTGWTVDGSHKIIKVANSAGGTSVSYSLVILGTSA